MDRCVENVIEFLENQKQATVTFSQSRYKTKIRRLAQSHPEDCRIVAENEDGSICAKVPVSWIKVSPPRIVSESQREAARRNLLKAQSVGREAK